MPWNNQSGGGNGGPWGQNSGGNGGGGGGGNRGGGNGPNIEDLFKQGRAQFGGSIPGGGRFGFLIAIVLLVAFVLSQSFYTVASDEVGVEQRFGKPKDVVSEAGLNFILWPFETVTKVSLSENQLRIGASNRGTDSGLMLSGDQNIVDVVFSVLWQVGAPADYIFNVRESAEILREVSESAMREVVGRRPAQDIFRDDKVAIEIEVNAIAQTILDSYGSGVRLTGVKIENAAPPAEVADAFDEVQRAEQDEVRFQEEARQYSNTLLGEARGSAAQQREEAAAYKDRVVKDADGEAARFVSIYDEYAKAPEVTRKRMFLETMEGVLRNSDKVILEKGVGGASGVLPYLPLPAITKSNAGAAQ